MVQRDAVRRDYGDDGLELQEIAPGFDKESPTTRACQSI